MSIMNIEEARKVASHMLLSRLCQSCTVGSIEFNNKKNEWEVDISVEYPRMIKNDETNSQYLRLLSFNSLGNLRFVRYGDSFKITQISNIDEMEKRLDMEFGSWRRRVENILVQTTSDQLSLLADTRVLFNPFREILTSIKSEGSISLEKIQTHPKHSRLLKYVNILVDLGLLVKRGSGFTYSNDLVGLEEKTGNDSRFIYQVIASVIKNRYSYLREILNIKQLEPFIRASNAFYSASLEMGELIPMRRRTLLENYEYLYGYKHEIKFANVVGKLQEVEILKKKDGLISGNSTVFDELLEHKSDIFTNQIMVM